MKQIILDHRAKYPAMLPRDFFKLLYQSEFGSEHLSADRETVLARLLEELETMEPADISEPLEPIGNGLFRLHLQALKRLALRPETVVGLFLQARSPIGGMAGLNAKLNLLAEALPQAAPAIAQYRAEGYPPQHHSPIYRVAYHPAYRLVPEQTVQFLPLFQRIDALLNEGRPIRIAIDGQRASGKTWLGEFLAKVYQANLLHMDDYFLPFDRKTPERLAEPGGNVDYERFLEEVISGPKEASIVYRPFDCVLDAPSDPVTLPPTQLTIIEGSYSMHPALRHGYDLTVCLFIDPPRQSGRILGRNGEEMHECFMRTLIPMDNRYFEELDIRSHADLSFDV